MIQNILQAKLFTEQECKTIIEYSKLYNNFIVTPLSSLRENSRNVYFSTEDKAWTKSYNVWDIPVHSNTGWMYNRVYDWFSKESGLSLTRQIDAHKLHQYRTGDKFDKHTDNIGMPDRIWNLGIQLNNEYKGGDYIVHLESNTIFLSKEIGNVVAYTSDVVHEITEITEGERWSMVIKVHDWELISKTKKTLM